MTEGDAPHRIKIVWFGVTRLYLPVSYVEHQARGSDLVLVRFLIRPELRVGQRGILTLLLLTRAGGDVDRCFDCREVLSITQQLSVTVVRFKAYTW